VHACFFTLQGHSKGYAFVEFATPESAQAAQKAINVRPGQKGGGGGGGDGGGKAGMKRWGMQAHSS
jgi:RNA recognition motif-containing protein